MRKCICMILAAILLLTSFYIGTPETYAATKPEKKRAIAVVFDNSGTMYKGSDDSRKTWCRATYAMQALATMMNPSDIMQIYPMNPIQLGDSENPPSDKVYTRERPLEIKQNTAHLIQEIFTPHAGNTHIEAVTRAREGLAKTDADEKWLIVLTDGTVFYRNNDELTPTESIKQLTAEFNSALAQVNAMYLGIGSEAQSGFAVKGPHQFVERKATSSAQVLAYLTELGNIIFGRDELPSVSENISFDVSMKKLIIFIQGESIDNVSLSGAKATSTDKLKYSTYGAKSHIGRFLCDTTLQGTMLTYENLDAGSYKISFSGNASDIAVYYEPDVDLDFVFTAADGSAVDPNALYEGEYKVSFGMKDAKTGKLISSELLGNPHYTGSYFINGQEYPISHDGYSGETPVILKMNDTFDANLTATYLSGYTITKNSTDFGWPQIGIQVAARPAGDLRIEISGGSGTYSVQELEEGAPYIVKLYYQGKQLTGDALKNAKLQWDPEKSNVELKSKFADDHYIISLHYKDSSNPQNTVCGSCRVPISAFYTAQGSKEANTQAILEYIIDEDVSSLGVELFTPEDYIVISELDSSQPIVVNLTLNGRPLTQEEFASLELQADCGGIAYTLIPKAESSSYLIQLASTEGIGEGDYTVKVTASFKDKIGRVTQSEGEQYLTLSQLPLWLKWLIGLLLLILLIIIIWLISHIRVLPSKAKVIAKESKVVVNGTAIPAPQIQGKIKKSLEVSTRIGAVPSGITLAVKPGKESYLYKKQKSRYAESTDGVVRKTGTARVDSISIGSVKYVRIDGTNNFDRKPASKAPITIRNGTNIKYSGVINSAGVEKPFSVSTKFKF